MPASAFEYALIRVVPRIERGEFVNVGVVLFCRVRRFLNVRIQVDAGRLRALDPAIDLDAVETQLAHLPLICAGGAAAGPIGELPAHERFRWMTAPRSTIVQSSPVHCGLCTDPAATLDQLLETLVA
jgi:hypothetical protein